MDQPLRHEHARGGGHRQQCAEGDEDLADQRGLVPGRAVAAGGQRRGCRCGRRRCHRNRCGDGGCCCVVVLLQRAIDVVELIGGDHLGIGRRRRVGRLVRAACKVLALADIALALSAGASADVNSALALATEAGIGAGVSLSVSATSSVFLVVVGFRRHLGGFVRRGPLPVPRCLFDDLAAVALSDFTIVGRAVRVGCHCRRRPRETYKQSGRQYQCRAPAGFDYHLAISPFARPQSEMRPCGVSTAGQKKGIFGLDRAKAGQRRSTARRFAPQSFADGCRDGWRVSGGAIDVMSLPGCELTGSIPDGAVRSCCPGTIDHDFVI